MQGVGELVRLRTARPQRVARLDAAGPASLASLMMRPAPTVSFQHRHHPSMGPRRAGSRLVERPCARFMVLRHPPEKGSAAPRRRPRSRPRPWRPRLATALVRQIDAADPRRLRLEVDDAEAVAGAGEGATLAREQRPVAGRRRVQRRDVEGRQALELAIADAHALQRDLDADRRAAVQSCERVGARRVFVVQRGLGVT